MGDSISLLQPGGLHYIAFGKPNSRIPGLFSAGSFYEDGFLSSSVELGLEVAEHLAPEKAEDFVALLCRASPAVLFSAAIQHQGGTHHVNERPQSYWAKLFAARGYRCFDVFRGPLWDNPSVDWWYRQNIVLYVEQENELAQRMSRMSKPQPIMDAVHPVAYENLMCLIQRPSFRFCLGCMKRWAQTWIRQIGGGHS